MLKDHVLPLLRTRAEPHFPLGTLWRLGFDAYEPETERYGGAAAIAIAERFFRFDSVLCLDLMDVVSKNDDTDLRWHLAVYGSIGCSGAWDSLWKKDIRWQEPWPNRVRNLT